MATWPAIFRMTGSKLALLRAWLRTRARILRLMPWLSTKPSDWDRTTFSQKLKWRCRHPDPLVDYGVWVDKARARELVKGRLSAPTLYSVIRHPREIDPSSLPATYVMKATHGWNKSLLVKDGVVVGLNRSDKGAGRPATAEFLQEVAEKWLKPRGERKRRARERHYGFIRPGILFEEYLDSIDYELQLFLFNGRLCVAMVFYRTFRRERTTHRLYDQNWSLLDPGDESFAPDYEVSGPPTPRPPRELLETLEELCRHIDHVRVDLYAVDGAYFLSEFTFTHAAGSAGNIGKYDAELGRHWMR
jgi:TupA-like ATPgrasp